MGLEHTSHPGEERGEDGKIGLFSAIPVDGLIRTSYFGEEEEEEEEGDDGKRGLFSATPVTGFIEEV